MPGTSGALGAARWLTDQMQVFGYRPSANVHVDAFSERFRATIPGLGSVPLQNLGFVVKGRSPDTIVVMAHRDDTGAGAGADDNASGTGALLELARLYAPSANATVQSEPQHTILFLSTDGGAFGGLGAAHFADRSPDRSHVVAVVNLDSIGGRGPPRLEIAGDAPRSPSPALVATAAARLAEQTGSTPGRTSVLGQLVDLGQPFSLYEQAPFVARGIPAITLTTAGDRPAAPFPDTAVDARRLGEIGRAAQELVESLDAGLELARGTRSYVYLGQRLVRGWAIEVALVAMLLPFALATVDLFARCRRRRIPVAPALRAYRSRLGFWLWVGSMFFLLTIAGVWPGGAPRPVNPSSAAAGAWPVLGLLLLACLALPGWLVARARIVRRRRPTAEEELAGHTAAMLALGVVALLVVATNPFALVFVLPSLHAWLWLPHVRERRLAARLGLVAAGLLGPFLLLGSFMVRFGLGLDAPWYLAELAAIGYVPLLSVALALGWLAGAGQVLALALDRYAPYPSARERPPRGPIRSTVRAVVLGIRAHRAERGLAAREAAEL